MGTTIEIRDSRGDSVTATRCLVTGYISVTLPNSEPFLVDPADQDGMAWLKRVFGAQLEYILERS
jgi:hypothetical protein